MSVNSRLHNIEESLHYRERALLWLKTSQEFEVNGAVITAAQGWSVLAGWGSLLGIAMIDTTPHSKPFDLAAVENFPELWCQKICAFFADVVTMEQAVDLISEGYFDGHDVLFKDSRGELTSSYEKANLLVLGYNCFAQDNGKAAIDIDALQRSPRRKVANTSTSGSYCLRVKA